MAKAYITKSLRTDPLLSEHLHQKEFLEIQKCILTLQELSQKLVSELNVTDILNEIMKTLGRALSAVWVNVWELTPDGKAAYIRQGYGRPGTEVYVKHSHKKPIKLGTAFIGRALKTKRTWVSSDMWTDPHLPRTWVKRVKEQNFRAIICVPQIVESARVVGGMCVYFDKPKVLTDLEMRLVTIAANQAAVAIVNANIYRELLSEREEIKEAYKVEKKARIELEELDKAKDQFMFTTQHHLRTPLTIVKGYLQSIIAQKTTKLDPATASYVAKAQESTDRISSLVNELLDISQVKVKKSILKKTQVKIKDMIDGVLEELETEIQDRNLSVKINAEGAVLNLDEHKIREALVNVIDNAIKYNKLKGNLTVTGMRAVHPVEKGKQIYKIVVEDTGIGLTPEELSKLFEQYFERGEEAEKLYTTGRGIGMAVTKNIIQSHGGKIYAESKGRGKGSKFTIELPVD